MPRACIFLQGTPCGLNPQVFTGHAGAVTCGGFTPDGKAVVTGGGEGDASLRVWNPKTGECTAAVQVGGATSRQQRRARAGM